MPHPARSLVAWLLVAEAQHEVAAAGNECGPHAVGKSRAVLVAEDVEQPAVEHGAEGLPEIGQLPGVPQEEPRRETAVAPFLSGVQRRGRDVDAGDVEAETRRT